jgi:hypothetical protein
MKQNVNKLAFHDAFVACGRGDQFSYKGRAALFDYLTELEDDCGQEIELDVIALCCDYSEHASLTDWADGYFASDWRAELGIDDDTDEEDTDDAIRDYIRDHGQLIEFAGGIIVSSF